MRRAFKRWRVRDTALLGLMLAVGAAVFSAPLSDIASIGLHDADQAHVYLAILVAAWLFWLRRSRLTLIKIRPSLFGPMLVAGGCILAWWSFQNDLHAAWHLSPLVVLIGMLVSYAGFEPIRQFAPVFLALLFALPVPESLRHAIALPMQSIAASVTHAGLELCGMQSTKLGNVLIVNGEQVAVAEACNGMRLVFSLSLVVFAFAFSTPLHTYTRLLLLAVSPLIAIAANVLRLIPASFIFGRVSADHAEQFHDLSGWVMLPLSLLAFVGGLKLLRWLDVPLTPHRMIYP